MIVTSAKMYRIKSLKRDVTLPDLDCSNDLQEDEPIAFPDLKSANTKGEVRKSAPDLKSAGDIYLDSHDEQITLPDLECVTDTYSERKLVKSVPIRDLKSASGIDLEDEELISLPDLDNASRTTIQTGYHRETEQTDNRKRKLPRICSSELKRRSAAHKKNKHRHSSEGQSTMSQSRRLFLDIVCRKECSEAEKRFRKINEYLTAAEKNNECGNDNVQTVKKIALRTEEEKSPVRSIRNMSRRELHSSLLKHRYTFRDIYFGKAYSRRHEEYNGGYKAKSDLVFQINIAPFKDEQLDYVTEFLMSEFYDKVIMDQCYILKVLLAEALIFIYMDFYGIDYEECERRMQDATFSSENAEVCDELTV